MPNATTSPEEGRLSQRWQIALVTFSILMLELCVIRWSSSQIRIFAYFNNLVLIGAFLGMGLGVALGRKHPGLHRWTLPLFMLLAGVLGFSDELGLAQMSFPDQSIQLWGGEVTEAKPFLFLERISIVISIHTLVIAVFACCAAPLGSLFQRLEPLKAYSSDLAGSLIGVICFSILSWQSTGPVAWVLFSLLPILLLQRFRPLQLATAVLACLAALHSQKDVIYSAYNRISIQQIPGETLELSVNRDFHQYLHDLSDRKLSEQDNSSAIGQVRKPLRLLYDLPFTINPERASALVVGAGTGNDVQAALRSGYGLVDSVDIDRRIIESGQKLHPEKPYSDPRARPIVEDARAYFEQNRGRQYDVVCYGLLDSHAMSSAMSTLRLDNYVYTEDGIRSAYGLVAPKGHLSLSVSCNSGRWFANRFYWMIRRATGVEPIMVPSQLHSAVTFLVPRPGAKLEIDRSKYTCWTGELEPEEATLVPSDDWPFLYTRPGVIPWGYIAIISYTLLLATVSTRRIFRTEAEGGFEWPLFLMGAAFMLIEARGVTSMSLLFGSTWIVNAAIFTGILAMVFLANQVVMRFRFTDPRPWFAGLALATLLLWAVPPGILNAYPLLVRGILGGLLTGLPIGFAGIIVPILLARSKAPSFALGANLLGSVLGGCLEYYSMLGGMRATALLALCLYLTAFLLLRRQHTASNAAS